MEYFIVDDLFPKLSHCAVTLGKFDGIHRGHRKLIDEIQRLKKEEGMTSVVVAFVSDRQMILSPKERRDLLAEMGVDVLLECPLDEKFRRTKAETFVRQTLLSRLDASAVVVGEDFRFGFERKGTPEFLKQCGEKYHFLTSILPKETEGNRKISSTYIREELKYGNMEKVSSLLGTDYFVSGKIKHGRGLGHKNFYPTTNLVPPQEKLLPPYGVYATISNIDGVEYAGITNVGVKPTIGETFPGVETFLFDCDENLYGDECTVYFKHFQRPEQKFSSFETLKRQIANDIENGKKILFT